MILLLGAPRQLLRTLLLRRWANRRLLEGALGHAIAHQRLLTSADSLGVTHSPALLPLLPPARRGRTLAACKTSLLRRSSATRGAIARPSLLGSPAHTTRISVPSALVDLPWLPALVLSLH